MAGIYNDHDGVSAQFTSLCFQFYRWRQVPETLCPFSPDGGSFCDPDWCGVLQTPSTRVNAPTIRAPSASKSRFWTPRPRPRPRPSHIIPRPWPRLRLSTRNILPTSWTPVLGLKKQWLAVTAQELAIWVDCVIVPYLYNELCHCFHINTARIVNSVQWQLPLSQNISH